MLLPIIALGVVEVCLRLFGYSYSTGFFKKEEEQGISYLVNNDDFSLRFFPPELARWPGTLKIPAKKPEDTTRIFVFGESAAMGDPQPAYGASRYLEVLLRYRFPGRKFEVINIAFTAINAHVILSIARECAKRDGDLWIVYMGNNEMVGPFGAATVFGSQVQLHLGGTAGWLAASALYAAVHLGSGNPMLILAAGVCGLFWGFLYLRFRSLLLNALSHTLWDLAVFIFWPVA